MNSLGELLSVEQVAARLHCSTGYVRRIVRDRAFPQAVRLGNRWLIPADDVDRWLRDRQPFRAR